MKEADSAGTAREVIRNMAAGYENIHSHQHDKPPVKMPHINVSVEQPDYRPVPLSDLWALARVLVKGRDIVFLFLGK